MANLRIKVILGTYNIELEGASEDVISQFEDLKKNGLGEIVGQFTNLVKATSTNVVSSEEPQLLKASASSTGNNPSIHDLAHKFIVSSETEWVLIYAYYINESGKTQFTRQDIIAKYEETSRKTTSALKNLSVYIGLNQKYDWLSKLNDKEYIITPGGIKKAKEILSKQEGSAKITKRQKKTDKDQGKSEEDNGNTN